MLKSPISLTIAALMLLVGSPELILAEQRFIDHGDGTVTDRKLGLMWAKTDNQSDILWNQIQDWLTGEFTDTIPRLYDNWRLPTAAELQSLFVEDSRYQGYQTRCGHHVKIVPQIRLSCILVWSSDMALGLPLVFDFNLGSAFSFGLHENKGCRVLPVRAIE